MTRAKDKYAGLQKALGHKFKDETLLRTALTHSSARAGRRQGNDNERLEFLGDRVLGLVIAELLGEMHPDADEGDLARLFNRLVQRETCTAVAQSVELAGFMTMSGAERARGGKAEAGILADAIEAVLGAIFLDAGFVKSRKVVRKLWSPFAEPGESEIRDPKTALQEWAQGHKRGLPVYVEASREGPDHAPLFIAEVRVERLEPARGSGTSKRLAEQAAARALLEREGIWEVTA